MDNEQVIVKNNEEAHRYEVTLDEQTAVLTYRKKGEHITFLHTGVPSVMEGQGVAHKLAQTALEDAQALHLTVTPECPFVAAYIRRHQEYLSLLSASEKARLLQG